MKKYGKNGKNNMKITVKRKKTVKSKKKKNSKKN